MSKQKRVAFGRMLSFALTTCLVIAEPLSVCAADSEKAIDEIEELGEILLSEESEQETVSYKEIPGDETGLVETDTETDNTEPMYSAVLNDKGEIESIIFELKPLKMGSEIPSKAEIYSINNEPETEVIVTDAYWQQAGEKCEYGKAYTACFKYELGEKAKLAENAWIGVLDAQHWLDSLFNPPYLNISQLTEPEGYYCVKWVAPSADEMTEITDKNIEITIPENLRYYGITRKVNVKDSFNTIYDIYDVEYEPVSDYSRLVDGLPVNAGIYRVNVTGFGQYYGTVSREFEVKPFEATVVPMYASKHYGEPDPELPYYIIEANVFEKDEIKNSLEGALGREEGEYAGDYNITAGTLKVKEDSHNFTIKIDDKEETFRIKPGSQKIEHVSNLTVKPGQLISMDELKKAFRIVRTPAVEGLDGDAIYQIVSGAALGELDDEGFHTGENCGKVSVMAMLAPLDINGDGKREYENESYQLGNVVFEINIDNREEVKISTDLQKYNKTCGDEDFNIIATADKTEESGTFTYSCDDMQERIVSIDSKSGKVHVIGAGKARVTVTYSSDNYLGQTYCDIEIEKKAGPAAPTGLSTTAVTSVYGKGRIIGTTKDMEYGEYINDSISLFTPCEEGETAVYGGMWGVRYAETDQDLAGEITPITVEDYKTEQTGLIIELGDDAPIVYDGQYKKPVIYVANDAGVLSENVDYTIKYKNNKEAFELPAGKSFGDYTDKELDKMKAPCAVIEFKNANIAGARNIWFQIEKKHLEPGDEKGETTPVIAVGPVSAPGISKASPMLYYGSTKLGNKDFDCSVAGKVMTVTGKGNYAGTRTIEIEESSGNQKDSIAADIKVKSLQYDGFSKELTVADGDRDIVNPDIVVYKKGDKQKTPLEYMKDFMILYPQDMENAGTKKIVIVGIGDYTGAVTKSIKILPVKTNSIWVSAPGSVTYSPGGVVFGDALDVEVTIDGHTMYLREGQDYKVKYSGNKKVNPKAKYTVSFLGNYKGNKAETGFFSIEPVQMEDCSVFAGDLWYDGKPGTYTSKLYISYDGYEVPKSSYSVKYYKGLSENNPITNKSPLKFEEDEDLALVNVVITGKGNFSGVCETAYNVVRKGDFYQYNDLTKAVVKITDPEGKKIDHFEYTGNPIENGINYKLTVTAKDNDGKECELTEGKDYKVYGHSNIYKGTMTVFIGGTAEGYESGWYGSTVLMVPIAGIEVK